MSTGRRTDSAWSVARRRRRRDRPCVSGGRRRRGRDRADRASRRGAVRLRPGDARDGRRASPSAAGASCSRVPSDGPLVTRRPSDSAPRRVVLSTPVLRKSVAEAAEPARASPGRSVIGLRASCGSLRRLRPDVVYVSTLTSRCGSRRAAPRRDPGARARARERAAGASRCVRAAIARPLRSPTGCSSTATSAATSLTEVVPRLARAVVVVYNGVAGPNVLHAPREHARRRPAGRLRRPALATQGRRRRDRRGGDARAERCRRPPRPRRWCLPRLRVVRAPAARAGRPTSASPSASRSTGSGRPSGAPRPTRTSPSCRRDSRSRSATRRSRRVLAARPVVVSAIGGLAEAIDGFASADPVEPDDALRSPTPCTGSRISGTGATFRGTAPTFAPIAAHRYSTDRLPRPPSPTRSTALVAGPEHALGPRRRSVTR